ncbi:hypothetical protein F4804DRAFT_310132 [Jackrogersella minutella]|nr:hypothetical protein F4804DRAFT_310132 [Jackrogersella minutella]
MEVTSPPKRMTRARAAAKDAANAATTTSTTTTTASSSSSSSSSTSTKTKTKTSTKAKPTKATPATTNTTTKPATTTTRNAKRKTPPDENEEDDIPQINVTSQRAMNKPAKTRGRPKKVPEPQPEPEHKPEPEPKSEPSAESGYTATTKATRSRSKKTPTTTATVAPKQDPPKTARASTRTRKTATEETTGEASTGPVKKTTRSRATSGTKSSAGVVTTAVSTEPTPGLKSAVSRPASRTGGANKKTVTFEEPEKENLLPAAPAKKSKTVESATGMRARPVRKPAATGRTTRASARTATTSGKRDKSPLSPKKDAENRSLSRDADSDDELATLEKTPLKPMMKSPVKPPNMAKKPDLQPPTKDADDNVQETSEPASASVFGSPARRPPSSPWKDAIKTPARKVDGIPSLVLPSENDEQAAQALSKSSILSSPAKRPHLPIKALQPPSQESSDVARSPVKMSLLQSPARRPASPFKLQGTPTHTLEYNSGRLFAPKTSPVPEISEEVEVEEVEEVKEEELSAEHQDVIETEDELAFNEQAEENVVELESPSQLAFPGRLSAVLPRHADPALRKNPLPMKDVVEFEQPQPASIKAAEVQEEPIPEATANKVEEDAMDIDEVEAKEEDNASPAPTTPPQSHPTKADNPAFGLRAKDLEDQDASDSEDELAASGKVTPKYQEDATITFSAVPATPTPSTFKANRGGMPSSAIKAASRAIRSVSKGSRFSLAPLSGRLSEWKAPSPTKRKINTEQVPSPELKEGFSLIKDGDSSPAQSTPSKGFFDEEMKIRAEMENQAAIEAALEAEIDAAYGEVEVEFDNIPITDEDMELAHEANEMSLIESAHDDSISDASQEYGDENAVPIDPALLGSNAGARRLDPVTPMRQPAPRAFATVSKVPLKPADDSSPRVAKKRCLSASRLPSVNRPNGFFRNATVISYSPTKDSNKMDIDEEDEPQYPPVTPSKSDIWSSMGTPARTPRRDLNAALLRGAVVFVDVHTSDGADASTVFIELLTQMGARCVKSWPWNPTSPTNSDGSSRVGITHVVYKDGGKRTLEKVRETGGVVQCVGVGWVLDCERENMWLDEAPYYVDTSVVPRGGHNRRKSMEPKALANFNGTLVAPVTPMKSLTGPSRECQTVPNNHISRRDSTAWMHSPSDHDEDEDAPGEHDWDREIGMLTPVPKTPAPEAVKRFAMDVTPDTPSTENYSDYSPEKDQLLMRTCPPKRYADLGGGLLKQEKDQGILMRLMAARRKSLQFAPKIASPLSKAWN